MFKKCQEFKGYGSIRKGIRGAVGILVLGYLATARNVVSANEIVETNPSTVENEYHLRSINPGEENALGSELDPVDDATSQGGETTSNEDSILVEIKETGNPAEVLEDRMAPKLLSYSFDRAEYQAGDAVTLTVEGEDESGLRLATADLRSSDQQHSIHLAAYNNPDSIEKLEDGRYRATLTGVIPENRPSDLYTLDNLSLYDTIDNFITYYSYDRVTNKVEPLSIKVQGTVTDRMAPRLNSYRFDKAEYQAGDTVTLTVEAEDESGLRLATAELRSSDQQRSIYLTSYNNPDSIEKLEDGRYRATLSTDIPKNRPSDTYTLENLSLYDTIGHSITHYSYEYATNKVEPLSINVEGTVTDRMAPRLNSYRFDKAEYQAGDTVTLTVEAEDESGLRLATAELRSLDQQRSIYLTSYNNPDSIEKLEDRRYRATLSTDIPKNRPSDTYTLENLSLYDTIGHSITHYSYEYATNKVEPLSIKVKSIRTGSVIIHYQLEDGTKIAEDKRVSGVVSTLANGDSQTTETGITYDTSNQAPVILNGFDGIQYYKVRAEGKESGVLQTGLTEVTYIYTPYLVSTEQIDKKIGRAIVQYQTKSGQTIKEAVEAIPETVISYREKSIYADGTEKLSEPIVHRPYFYSDDYRQQEIEYDGISYSPSYQNQLNNYHELSEGETVITLIYVPKPRLESLTFDKNSYKPGEKVTAHFTISSKEEMERIFFGLSDNTLTGQYLMRGESETPILIGDNLYRFDVILPLDSDYPKSEVSLAFLYLTAKNDSHSNTVSDPTIIKDITASFNVDSPNVITDFSGPKILELKTLTPKVSQGNLVELDILVEEVSDIASVSLMFRNSTDRTSPEGFIRLGDGIKKIESLTGNQKKLTLSEQIHFSYQPGEYKLASLSLTDIYGNTTYLSSEEDLPTEQFIVNKVEASNGIEPIVETSVLFKVEVVDQSSDRVLFRMNFLGEDYDLMKQTIREAIRSYEKEHGVAFELLGAGGTQISSITKTTGNKTQTEIVRLHEQRVVNISKNPLPKEKPSLLPDGTIYDNYNKRTMLYSIQFKDGDSIVKESRRVLDATIDYIIRDESIGIDEDKYSFDFVDVSHGFTTIFSDDLNYNGSFYTIVVHLKSKSMIPKESIKNHVLLNGDQQLLMFDPEGTQLQILEKSDFYPNNLNLKISRSSNSKPQFEFDNVDASKNQLKPSNEMRFYPILQTTNQSSLPRTNEKQSTFSIFTGLSLLALIVVRRKKS